jgi:hypothetical protein
MWKLSLRKVCLGIVVLLFLGCGGPDVKKAPVEQTQQTTAEPMNDPFLAFGGIHVELGQDVTLHREPIGIESLRIVITLMRTEWTERERADGTLDREGTAIFYIQKGDAETELRVKQDEPAAAFGIQIAVKAAGEAYEQESMRYVPFANVVFTRAQ